MEEATRHTDPVSRPVIYLAFSGVSKGLVEHINALPHRQQLGNLLVVQKQGHIYDSPSVLLLVSHRVSSEICVQARTAVQYSTGDFLRIGINSASSFATITDGYAA